MVEVSTVAALHWLAVQLSWTEKWRPPYCSQHMPERRRKGQKSATGVTNLRRIAHLRIVSGGCIGGVELGRIGAVWESRRSAHYGNTGRLGARRRRSTSTRRRRAAATTAASSTTAFSRRTATGSTRGSALLTAALLLSADRRHETVLVLHSANKQLSKEDRIDTHSLMDMSLPNLPEGDGGEPVLMLMRSEP